MDIGQVLGALLPEAWGHFEITSLIRELFGECKNRTKASECL